MATAESKWQTDSGNATSAWNNAETAATNRWNASEGEARVEWKIASDAAVNAWNLEETNAVDEYNADVADANAEWKTTNDNAYTIYSGAYDNALALWNSKQATAASVFTNAIQSANATAIGAEANAWNAYVNASNGQMLGARLAACACDDEPPTCADDPLAKERKERGLLDTVDKVNGSWPINGSYAGKTFTPEDKKIAKKYPNGVKFNEKGFPDFKPYSVKTVTIDYQGTRPKDFTEADKVAGWTKANPKPKDHTWHHVEDVDGKGKGTMHLVPRACYALNASGGGRIGYEH